MVVLMLLVLATGLIAAGFTVRRPGKPDGLSIFFWSIGALVAAVAILVALGQIGWFSAPPLLIRN